jgi:general secretion pathway protein C
MAQVNLDILTQYNAFNPEATAPDLFAGAAETSLNLRLAGIRAADGDEGGAGIVILADGTQRRVATGEEFMPGVVMHSVTPDRAILRHSGRYETLSLSSSSPSLIAPERSGPPGGTAAPMAFSASQVFQDTEFRPESPGGQLAGYRLSPRTNLGAFRAGGLEAGDLVVRVNGQPVQELGPDTLAAALTASPDAIMLDVIRGGASLRLQVPPEGNSG